jgi:prephenate dehydrogenase
MGREQNSTSNAGLDDGQTGDVKEIGIVGACRFGSYFAAQLEGVGYRVHTADNRVGSAKYTGDLSRVCASPTVIYAVPIRALEATIIETRPRLAPHAVVMDVCSVKMIPCATLERHLPGMAIAGTHPLFGRESAPDRCAGQRIALCTPSSLQGTSLGQAAAARAERIFSSLGLTIVRCTPAQHDAQVARSQFLTHLIGRGAEKCGIARVDLSTKSHDDLMDIIEIVCHDSPELFEDMAVFNPMVAVARREFMAALNAIDAHLSEREREPGTAARLD